MDWKKYTDHIYVIHSNDNNEDYYNELKSAGITNEIYSEHFYVLDNKFIDYKYFKDIAVVDVIKNAVENNYKSIIIIRDDIKFSNKIESELNKCNDYIFSILNADDICEDIWLIKKPVIDYIYSLLRKNTEVSTYFEGDYEEISQFAETNWNKKIINNITNNFKVNKVNICKHKIDFVISYVDASDPEWQKIYNKSKNTVESFNDINRWRDFGFLEYNIILLNKYLPWLNKIYIIVSQNSQIPNWTKKYKNVEIILHENYIPKKVLPTFNSCTIESYLFNIQQLSEYFIYGNDDTFCINTLYWKDFFEEGKIKTNIVDLGEVNTNHLQICKNSFKLILHDFNNDFFNEVKLDKKYKRLTHIPHPMLKSTGLHIYSMFKKEIDKSISKFRTNNCINQFIFVLYDYIQQNYILYKLPATYCELDNIDKIQKTFTSDKIKLTCINDTKIDYANQDILVAQIKQIFEDKIKS